MQNNDYIPPKYKQYSSRMKEITRWQAIRLKEMGYKNIYISNLLGIHSSTISLWYKKSLKNNDKYTYTAEATLVDTFGKLLPEENKIIFYYVEQLINNNLKRSEVAKILGLSSGAVISGWLNKKRQIDLNKSSKSPRRSLKNKLVRKQVFNKYSKRMKDIIHWQIIHLKSKGYDLSFIESLLNVDKPSISKYWDLHTKDSRKKDYLSSDTITKKFGSLSVREKEMLLSQVAFLENKGIQRSEIANLIGLSSGAVISGWYQEKIKTNQQDNKQDSTTLFHDAVFQILNSLEFRQYKKDTKDLIRWQSIFLIKKGYKRTEISKILNIHTSTISRWWKAYLKSGSKPKISNNSKIKNQFKNLTPEMKRVISLQIIKLKKQKYTHQEIANILALNDANLVARWIKNLSTFTDAHLSPTVANEPVNLPQIGLISKINQTNNASKIKDKYVDVKNINLTKEPLTSSSQNQNDNAYFLKNEKNNTIELKENTKIIKAIDYSHYFKAETLIEASKINLLKSKKKAQKIKTKAEKSAEVITKKIIKQAEKKAQKKAEELLAEKNIAAANSATEYLNSLQENLPDIIMAIVNKFIENYDDRDFIIHTINSAISEINNKEKVKIYVNSKVLNDVKKRLHKVKYPNEKITLVSDTTIKKKNCLIVTKLGVVNANLENQIKKIENNLKAACTF